MGEAKQRGASGGYYGEAAPRLFVNAWIKAASGVEVVFRDACMADGTWVVAATIGTGFCALLTPPQARATADAFAHYIEDARFDALHGPMADVAMALRQAADEMERLHPAPSALVTPEPPRLVPSGLGG